MRLLPLFALILVAAEPKPDLTGYRTVEQAVTTAIDKTPIVATETTQAGYLGIALEKADSGWIVASVDADSPAAKADVQVGDLLLKLAGEPLTKPTQLRERLQATPPGTALSLTFRRGEKSLERSITLTAPSRPLTGSQRAILGIQVEPAGGGLRVDQITPNSPAAKADLKTGDVILKLDETATPDRDKLSDLMGAKRPGDKITLTVKRDGKEKRLPVTLGSEAAFDPAKFFRWDDRPSPFWKKETYRLAVVPIAYPDVSFNEKVTVNDWDKALFSKAKYSDKSPTGQKVFGSLRDYYLEQSCGKLAVEGKVFAPVKVEKKRTEYSTAGPRGALLTEALDKLLDRDGKKALADFDGICFLYAGDRVRTQRGGIYWPHRASLAHKGKRWAYFIVPEGGERMASISVIAHEFGHMLGMPDLYNQPDNPTSEGVGVWCTMSTGHGNDGKPLHFSAWCKEQLGWLKPALIDPTVKQKLLLAPIEDSARECFKVLIRADGSEYLLLENRTRKGFDRDLPAEGMLIWRVVDGRPLLEESHGITGPDGPRRYLGSVPYPSNSNRAFTPETTPSSKPRKTGGRPVHITNIRKLSDGRIAFDIGYEFF